MDSVQATHPAASLFDVLNGAREQTGAKAVDSQNRFLTLLTTQLKNQDPLNPMDNAQMTSQLAQISTVDGIERLNSTLQALTASSEESRGLEAAGLVGHGVMVPGRQLLLREGAAIGGVELAEAADAVSAVVTDANGLVVRTLDLGAREAGSHAFHWDGTADSGAAAADGAYTVELKALREGKAVGASALELAVVRSVIRNGREVSLDLGSQGTVGLSQVKQII